MKPKINDMYFQMLAQNNQKPPLKYAIEAWDEVRLQLDDSIAVKLLDNFFKL